MPPIEECCVLLPCHSLDDVPQSVSSRHAEGFLGGWTASWHPRLIATTGKIPTWFPANIPPPGKTGVFFFIPEISANRLPADFEQTHAASISLRENTREAFLAAPELRSFDLIGAPDEASKFACDNHSGDTISRVAPEDFFALAYTMLQIQVMTRQVRYACNLDEIEFAGYAICAAQAWADGKHAESVDAMKRAFALLTEERNHYFSSDPYLIDLTLVVETTLEGSLDKTLAEPGIANLLVDGRVTDLLPQANPNAIVQIQQRLAKQTLGLAGGAPASDLSLDHLTAAAVSQWLEKGKRSFETVLGTSPEVFGRPEGSTPGDLVQWLPQQGYSGAIPINFSSGQGYREASRLSWQVGVATLESLVAKPIDASDAAGFVNLGRTLGHAIDYGSVPTALLVHWPGQMCQAYQDLRRACRWDRSLGAFWTLPDYFLQGDPSYHHLQKASIDADGDWLSRQIQQGVTDPLSKIAAETKRTVAAEAARVLQGIAYLVAGVATNPESSKEQSSSKPIPFASSEANQIETMTLNFGEGLSSQDQENPEKITLLNPHSSPLRIAVTLPGPVPPMAPPLFAAHATDQNETQAFVDVPAHGFACVVPAKTAEKKRWQKRVKPIARPRRLVNEFMDVRIGEMGTLNAVYSGPVRGNRFSWQLCHYDHQASDPCTTMVSDRIEVTESNGAAGEIVCNGRLIRKKQAVASYRIVYRLERGSRLLEISGSIDTTESLQMQPWQSYFAGRSAVASDASVTKAIVRDKLHCVKGCRLNAPLGVVIDEGDRTLLVSADGLPSHRRCGDRILDTLLIVSGETRRDFRLHYGFDIPSPVPFARSLLSPTFQVDRRAPSPVHPVGWLLHVDTRRVIITDCRLDPTHAGSRLVVRLVETSGKFVSTTVRLPRDPIWAKKMADKTELDVHGDAISVSLAGHETAEIEIAFS